MSAPSHPAWTSSSNVIRNDGGTIDNVDIWGRRRLAYEIQKKTEGIYAVVNFTATSEATVELDRQLKLSEAVLRTKVLRAEEAVAARSRPGRRREARGRKAARAKRREAARGSGRAPPSRLPPRSGRRPRRRPLPRAARSASRCRVRRDRAAATAGE